MIRIALNVNWTKLEQFTNKQVALKVYILGIPLLFMVKKDA